MVQLKDEIDKIENQSKQIADIRKDIVELMEEL